MGTKEATKVRIKIGKETDLELLKYIEENPKKTIYELSKKLEWSVGKVQKSIKRLDKKVFYEQEIGEGRLRKKYSVST